MTFMPHIIMWQRFLQITSIIAVALSFAAGFAHVLEAYTKLRLPKEEYFVVQQIYRGWALLGIVIFIALIATFLLAIQTRHQPAFTWNLLSCICILTALIFFFIFTFPVNQQTNNWTVMPENWQQLRSRWEYSHIVNAVVYFTALLLLVIPRK